MYIRFYAWTKLSLKMTVTSGFGLLAMIATHCDKTTLNWFYFTYGYIWTYGKGTTDGNKWSFAFAFQSFISCRNDNTVLQHVVIYTNIMVQIWVLHR